MHLGWPHNCSHLLSLTLYCTPLTKQELVGNYVISQYSQYSQKMVLIVRQIRLEEELYIEHILTGQN